MSAKNESYNDYVQIVKDVIDIGLIDSVVAKLPSNTTGTTDPVATSLDWTPACDDFFTNLQDRSLSNGRSKETEVCD